MAVKKKFPYRSAFVACNGGCHVTEGSSCSYGCIACGKCVEFCPAGAVKLGQKLCDKEGCEVTYPRIPLPSEQPWGEHMWSHNYRDVNRINCYDTGTAPCKNCLSGTYRCTGVSETGKRGTLR